MIYSLLFGTFFGLISGAVWGFGIGANLQSGLIYGAIVGSMIGLLSGLSQRAAASYGEVEYKEAASANSSMMTLIFLASTVIATVIAVVRLIFF